MEILLWGRFIYLDKLFDSADFFETLANFVWKVKDNFNTQKVTVDDC